MCLSKERTSRHDDYLAARPIPKSQSAMPKAPPEMRQKPATAPATAMPIPATRNNTAATTTNAAAKSPAQPARSKQVIVSQQQDAGPRVRSGTDAGDASGTGTATSGPPQRGSIHALTTLPHPLQAAPLNTTNATSRSQLRQPSTFAPGPRKWAAMAAAEDEADINSLQLTLSRSGSVTYATSPRMSMSSVGGVPTRTKTRERIVVIDESGRRREYFR